MTPVIAVFGYDITAVNYPRRGKAQQIALYISGSGGIAATPAMLAANPDAVLIDQSPNLDAHYTTADVIDYENGTIALADLPDAVKNMLDSYNLGDRPGQRTPLVYASWSRLAEVTGALTQAGINPGQCGLFPADWGLTSQAAAAKLGTLYHGYPIRAFQYQNLAYQDNDVFDKAWLDDRSKPHAPAPENTVKAQLPPGQWNTGSGDFYTQAVLTGITRTGAIEIHVYDDVDGAWSKL